MASTAAQRRGLNGVTSLRRKLRRMPEAVEQYLRPEVDATAAAMAATARTLVSKDTGELAASIEYKLSPDGMTALIGPAAKSAAVIKASTAKSIDKQTPKKPISAGSREKLFQFFKGVWLEFGTKGNPDKGIPPQPARPYMRPAFDVNKIPGLNRITRGLNAVLRKVGGL